MRKQQEEQAASQASDAAEDDVARVDIPIECHQICGTHTGLGVSSPEHGESENISPPQAYPHEPGDI